MKQSSTYLLKVIILCGFFAACSAQLAVCVNDLSTSVTCGTYNQADCDKINPLVRGYRLYSKNGKCCCAIPLCSIGEILPCATVTPFPILSARCTAFYGTESVFSRSASALSNPCCCTDPPTTTTTTTTRSTTSTTTTTLTTTTKKPKMEICNLDLSNAVPCGSNTNTDCDNITPFTSGYAILSKNGKCCCTIPRCDNGKLLPCVTIVPEKIINPRCTVAYGSKFYFTKVPYGTLSACCCTDVETKPIYPVCTLNLDNSITCPSTLDDTLCDSSTFQGKTYKGLQMVNPKGKCCCSAPELVKEKFMTPCFPGATNDLPAIYSPMCQAAFGIAYAYFESTSGRCGCGVGI